jgi:hypothetical protein
MADSTFRPKRPTAAKQAAMKEPSAEAPAASGAKEPSAKAPAGVVATTAEDTTGSAFRPKRPTATKQDAAKAAAKLTKEEARLSIRITRSSLYAIKVAAAQQQMTVKQFVARAMADAGAKISDVDLLGE